MDKYIFSFFKRIKRRKMSSSQTLVCVKQVKQESPEEWDENMPLPGDIIEGFAEEYADELFVLVKGRLELSSQLGKISKQADSIWVKVRRGDSTLKIRACVVPEKCSKLQRRFTIRASSDDRHVAVLGDLTIEQCTELQEMSRRVVNVECRGFNRKAVKYDWKMKLGTYLPDNRSTVVSSILFMPMAGEYCIDSTTTRSMAWFSAAVSSGAPLVFVNIQTEQILTSGKANSSGKEITWGRPQNQTKTFQVVQGVRLWFLPGVAEVSLELIPLPGEARFGMDIKRTDEGFICVYFVTKRSAADRAGLKNLHEEAMSGEKLLVVSRLEGKSLMPSYINSAGLINCCDHNEIRDTLTSAMDRMDSIVLHIMAWPNKTHSHDPPAIGAAALRPPNGF